MVKTDYKGPASSLPHETPSQFHVRSSIPTLSDALSPRLCKKQHRADQVPLEAHPLLPSKQNSDYCDEDISLVRETFPTATRRRSREPRKRRSCTDLGALLLFLFYWIGMILLACFAFTRKSSSEFKKYTQNKADFQGQKCADDRYLYFPDLRHNPAFRVCVDECPDRDGRIITLELPVLSRGRHSEDAYKHVKLRDVDFITYETDVNGHICDPVGEMARGAKYDQSFDYSGQLVGALGKTWKVFLFGSVISLGTASLYLILLRFCGRAVLTISIIGVQGILIYGSYRLLQSSLDPYAYKHNHTMKQTLQLLAVGLCCCTILFFVSVLIMLQRLLLAGIFITHASRALSGLKKILLVPFLTVSITVCLFVWGIQVMLSIFEAGTVSSRITRIAAYSPSTVSVVTETFKAHSKLRWMTLYHLWGIYWSVQFVSGIGEMITAIAISIWYFEQDHSKRDKTRLGMPYRDPVAYAIRSTFSYHLGTIAFSSATVTIVQTSRSLYEHMIKRNEEELNPLLSFITKFCCCFVWWFDCLLKYFSKEAMYVTAIQGTNYFRSSKVAYTLMSSNLVRYGALDRIGHASVVVGKLIVCTSTCLWSWYFLEETISPILPMLMILLLSYSIANAFLNVYETAINVLLLCFTLDENLHGGRGQSAYAPAALARSVDADLRPKWQTIL